MTWSATKILFKVRPWWTKFLLKWLPEQIHLWLVQYIHIVLLFCRHWYILVYKAALFLLPSYWPTFIRKVWEVIVYSPKTSVLLVSQKSTLNMEKEIQICSLVHLDSAAKSTKNVIFKWPAGSYFKLEMFSLNNTIPVCWNETATFTHVVGFISILVVFPFYSLSLAHLVYLLILCVFLCVCYQSIALMFVLARTLL